ERRRLEGVVALAAHVERRIERLVRIVVVADRGVELHPAVEQRLVRELEALAVELGGAAVVDVVAEHDDEVVVEDLPEGLHLRRDFVLRLVAAARVADRGEANRSRFSREGKKLGRRASRDGRRGGDRWRRLLRRRRLTPAGAG